MSERVRTVIETLRFCASGWVQDTEIEGGDNRKWLTETADEIERTEPADWVCCPLCQEITCDSNCPLRPVRQQAPWSERRA